MGVSHRNRWVAATAVVAALLAAPTPAPPAHDFDFDKDLARIDAALTKNPSHVPESTLRSCRDRRDAAVRLHESGHGARAQRALRYCHQALKIVVVTPAEAPPSMEELQARATHELERALALTPDVAHGLAVYRECAACHTTEGFGLSNGSVPQIAGQHREVIVKQLADIRTGHRDSPLMAPYSSVESIGGPQSVADVAAYIATLEISDQTSKGPGLDRRLGARLYAANCADCHGETGEGNAEKRIPRIQAQHYPYLVRQFEWIRSGKRRNANADMVDQIRDLGERETRAVLDYVSRLEPPEDLRAPPGWHNPDFAGPD